MSIAIVFLLAWICALVGGFVVAMVWWWCNTVTDEIDQADFDNEAHWHKWADVQSKRGDL